MGAGFSGPHLKDMLKGTLFTVSRNWPAQRGPSGVSKTPEVKASEHRKYKCWLLHNGRPTDPKPRALGQESLFSHFLTSDSGAHYTLRSTAAGFTLLCSPQHREQ